MHRWRSIGIVVVAVLVLGATAVSSAQAISPAPFFTINGTRLVAGKTHNFAGHIVKPFVLNTPEQGVKIECARLTVEKGVLLGSNEGEPGKAAGIAKFTSCSMVEGNGAPGCKLENETITTNQLLSEQVENVSGTGGGKQLLKEIFPASGANFVTLHFTGSDCTTTETAVSGQVVAEVLLDNAAEGRIELGQAPEQATSWLSKFPPTAIKEVWLITNGVGKIAKTKQLAFGDSSTQTGTELSLLANASFAPEAALWSPLP
jgi:hypothetical protein